MKRFAVQSCEVPILELRKYINRNEDALRVVDPLKFEELVASVFSDTFGYRVESMSYGRPDRGIDIVFIGLTSGDKIAVQVKRYNSPIKLGLIQQFLGALVSRDLRKGVLV